MQRSVIVYRRDAGCKALHKAPCWETNLSPPRRTRKTEAGQTPMVISLPTSLIPFEQECYVVPFLISLVAECIRMTFNACLF